MATPAFGPVLEASLKEDIQGGRLYMSLGITIKPNFFCCISGNTVGVAKDPVAHMVLSATSLCTATAITLTYSGSWSPSSTINSWDVDWGDGNTSTGAWPGAGSVAHPGGGYILPGTYTVTLTVTDLLGATGEASMTVEVIDCTAIVIAMLGGCGSSGTWATPNAGINWSEIGGGTVEGAQVYDLKANLFTVGLPIVEVWIATDIGLFKGEYNTVSEAATWQRITLPAPALGAGVPTARALCPSKYDQDEFYVLATTTGGAGATWLFRTTDGGATWDSTGGGSEPVELGYVDWEEVDGGANGIIWDIDHNDDELYVCGEFTQIGGIAANRIARYDGENWYAMGAGFTQTIYNLDVNDLGTLYVATRDTVDTTSAILYYWDSGDQFWYEVSRTPTAVNAIDTTVHPGINLSSSPLDTTIVVAFNRLIDVNAEPNVYIWDWASANWSTACLNNDLADRGAFAVEHDSFGNVAWIGSGVAVVVPPIPQWSGTFNIGDADCSGIPGGQPDQSLAAIWTNNRTGLIWCGGNFATIGGITASRFAVYEPDIGVWAAPITTTPFGSTINCIRGYGDRDVYVGLNSTVRHYMGPAASLPYVGTGLGDTVNGVCRFDDHVYAVGVFNRGAGDDADYIARTTVAEPLDPQADGLMHSMDMSADGQFVYVAGTNIYGNQVIIRVYYDLSYMDVVTDEGGGSWVGVVCDPYYGSVVWAFGDIDGADKIRLSEDWGATWTDMTDGGWGGGEVVRPLLISYWDTGDVVAILNTALESWQSKDSGTTWTQTGTTAFAAQCGARDPWEPLNIWIGRAAAGANHIQYSPNVGVNWIEHSGGFEAAAPVSSLVVIG